MIIISSCLSSSISVTQAAKITREHSVCVDLHTHSVYSDGTATPAELVRLAAVKGLYGLALTDHDTMDGLAQLIDQGTKEGLTVVPGIEISARHQDHAVHILGYGIEPGNSDLKSWLTRIQHGREARNHKIVERLNQLGYAIDMKELEQVSPLGQTGRPHIARLLVSKRMISSPGQAFRTLLGKGKPAYVKRFTYSAVETITAIHRAGGVAVLAHPGQIDHQFRTQPGLIGELALRGLDGVEVYYPAHDTPMRKRLLDLARRHDLLVTGGSDFHGSNRPTHQLAGTSAHCPPDHLLDALHLRLAKRASIQTPH